MIARFYVPIPIPGRIAVHPGVSAMLLPELYIPDLIRWALQPMLRSWYFLEYLTKLLFLLVAQLRSPVYR